VEVFLFALVGRRYLQILLVELTRSAAPRERIFMFEVEGWNDKGNEES